MEHSDYFNVFLRDTVNLGQVKLDLLQSRVDSIYSALKADATLSSLIRAKNPQGSWAQRTIINPLKGKEFDADFMLHLHEVPGWSDEVRQYNDAIYWALDRHSTYSGMPHQRKCRCVRLAYANSMHVDIVPYVLLSDGREVIVNRDANCWEDTNPGGFTAWMKEKDGIAGGNLRKVIRMMKYLRDHKNSFTGTRSVILTTVLGEQVTEWKKIIDPGYYKNVPTALKNIVSDLDSWLQANPTKPTILDPSGSGASFDHRWSPETYAYFRARMNVHAREIREAYEETDPTASVQKWQALFGEGFKAPEQASSDGKFLPASTTTTIPTSTTGRSGRAG